LNVVSEWLRRVWYLLNRRRFDEELRRDMEAHRAMMDDPRRFGSTLRLREESRDIWGWRWLDDLARDVRYACRTLVSHKAFTITAITTLALGIGVTTAIFSVVSALVLRPLPFPNPDRLVQMYGSTPLSPMRDAVGDFATFRRESTSFEALVGYEFGARYLRDSIGS
jgi:hypothetical protein